MKLESANPRRRANGLERVEIALNTKAITATSQIIKKQEELAELETIKAITDEARRANV